MRAPAFRSLSTRHTIVLAVSLIAPSLSIVHLHAGAAGTVVYVLFAIAVVWLGPSLPLPSSPRARAWLAALTFVGIAVAFAVVYPRVNVHVPGAGSDDDDALNVGVRALAAGQSPYGERTYLGNALHQLPGAFVIAAPFVAAGSSALQNLFWIPLFLLAIRRERRDRAPAEVADAETLRLAWMLLLSCPVVIDEIVTGTGHGANAIYVLLGLWWLTRTRRPVAASAAWGVALASRLNFPALLPIGFAAVRARWGSGVAAAATAVSAAVVVGLAAPFYLAHPGAFGPTESLSRLNVFNQYLPHAGMMIASAVIGVALWLATRVDGTASVFAAAAVVLALPVAAGVALVLPYDRAFALDFASYGLFSTWFVVMWLATSGPRMDAGGRAPAARS